MKLLSDTYNDEDFNTAINELKQSGWKVKRQYGGTLPSFKGHGAELEKFCFASKKRNY